MTSPEVVDECLAVVLLLQVVVNDFIRAMPVTTSKVLALTFIAGTKISDSPSTSPVLQSLVRAVEVSPGPEEARESGLRQDAAGQESRAGKAPAIGSKNPEIRTTDKTSTSSRKAYLLQFCKFGFFNTDCQQGVFHEHAFQQWPVRVTRHSVT